MAADLRALAERLRDRGRADEAEIVGIGALIADDPALRAEARREADEGRTPVEAVTRAAERYAAAIAAIGDPVLAERAADVRQVGRRAVAHLTPGGSPAAGSVNGSGGAILVADELGPADILGMEEGDIVAAAAVRGGPNAHAAIVARSLGLPLVLGVDADLLRVGEGTSLVVDGDSGSVTVTPNDTELSAARTAMESAARRKTALASERGLPSETADGVAVALLCNVATAAETRAGLEAGADGVGLLRTELPFLDASSWPDEEAHRRMLRPILSQLSGRVATVRVLDFGGDKVPPFLTVAQDGSEGQARGLPPLLRTPDALGSQLRAALRAGAGTRLRILVPMVTSLREVRLAARSSTARSGRSATREPFNPSSASWSRSPRPRCSRSAWRTRSTSCRSERTPHRTRARRAPPRPRRASGAGRAPHGDHPDQPRGARRPDERQARRRVR